MFSGENLMKGGAQVAGAIGPNWKNPSSQGMKYLDQMPGQIDKYMDYYNQGGRDAGGRLNEIGQNYQQSPGFDFALQQALQGSNHAAASGGMAGSPQHEQQNMQVATGLANQDYNQWMQNALGIYGIGAQTGIAEGEDMASILASQAKLAYEGQNAENQHSGGMWGSVLGGIGTAVGGGFGGPVGGMAGGAAGKAIGGMF